MRKHPNGNPARSRRPERLLAKAPKRRRAQACAIDGPIKHKAFLAYAMQILSLTRKAGDIVVSDYISAHGIERVGVIEAAEPSLVYLPPYSPDFNPIEQLFAKLKDCCESLQSVPPMSMEPDRQPA
jgi:hypothetical protein